MSLIANARMYALNATVSDDWDALFAEVAQRSGVPLAVVAHPAPAPLQELWRRRDLGLAFICGFPFAGGEFQLQAVAAPIPASGQGRAVYATHLVVRADSPMRRLEDCFGRRLGWTVAHSQSGFNALRTHLLPCRRQGRALFSRSVGPLLTPRRVVAALLDGEIDLGPLDSYVYDLLAATEPETAARLRIVDTTAFRPMPLLAASRPVPDETILALRRALLALADDASGQSMLRALRLTGFARVAAQDYRVLIEEARAADAAGYAVPG